MKFISGILLFLTILYIASAQTFSSIHTSFDSTSSHNLDLTAAQYSEINALISSRLSAAAYCANAPSPALSNWTCEACTASGIQLTDVTPLNSPTYDVHGFMGFVSTPQPMIIVAFSGSSNIGNWIANIDFGLTPYSIAGGNAQVHKGFLHSYQGARGIILAMLASQLYKHPNAAVWITGHSFGGALAIHAALDLKYSYQITKHSVLGIDYYTTGNPMYDNDVPSLSMLQSIGNVTTLTAPYNIITPIYTFGQPRVGNPEFASWLHTKGLPDGLLRVVHWKDLVPHLPPLEPPTQIIKYKYRHAPREIFYTRSNDHYTVCSPTDGEDLKCSDQFPIPTSVDDHLNYLGFHLGTGNGC